MFVQTGDIPAGTVSTDATKAKPAVVSFAAPPAGVAVGDIVMPSGFNWRSIDGRPFQASVIAANDVTLYDSDTVAEVADAALGSVAKVPLTEFCMATLTFTSPAGTDIDVTTLCDAARETVSGLPAVSTWQATGFWDADDATQLRLRELYRTGEKVVFVARFNDGSGLAFKANVNSFDVRAGVDQAVAITVGGTMSGQVSMLPPNA